MTKPKFQTKITSSGRQPQNIKSVISKQPLMGSNSNWKTIHSHKFMVSSIDSIYKTKWSIYKTKLCFSYLKPSSLIEHLLLLKIQAAQ